MNPDYKKTMLENKLVRCGERNYRLSIEKRIGGYAAYLSDADSQFTSSKLFCDLEGLKCGLMDWLHEADKNNKNPEEILFDYLKKWNGVVVL